MAKPMDCMSFVFCAICVSGSGNELLAHVRATLMVIMEGKARCSHTNTEETVLGKM
jgi:hypothetical protein